MASLYDQYKSQSGTFTKVAETKIEEPKKEGFIKRAARAILPESIEEKVVGPKPVVEIKEPMPQQRVSLYSQFKEKQGVFEQKLSTGDVSTIKPIKDSIAGKTSLYEQYRQEKAGIKPIKEEVMPEKGIISKLIDTGWDVAKFFKQDFVDLKKKAEERQPILGEMKSIDELVKDKLNEPKIKEGIKIFAEATKNLPLKSYAIAKSIGEGEFKNRYDIYRDLQEKYEDPNSPTIKRFLYNVQNTVPQTAIGVLLSVGSTALTKNPAVGTSVAGAYWAGLSADAQIQEKGRVESMGNIVIDTIGDIILGKYIEGILGQKLSTIKNSILRILSASGKGAVIEGKTEVMQTLFKDANDYRNAKTLSEKEAIIEKTKQYVLSGDILMEFSVAATAGALLSGASSLIGEKIQPSKITPAETTVSVIEEERKEKPIIEPEIKEAPLIIEKETTLPAEQVLFHGTTKENADKIISEGKVIATTDEIATYGPGIYLTDNKQVAQEYAKETAIMKRKV